MAELAIIAMAAIAAPVLVALHISLGRRVGAIAPRRQMRESPPTSRPWASSGESAERKNAIHDQRSGLEDVRYCQACGNVTLAHARYCRVCGSLLDAD